MELGTREVAVNETDPSGVLFVMRPPDLRMEPQREDHDTSSDDTKMAQICERIRRVRRDDLSQAGLDFWTALEQLHQRGRYAAAVPSLPHTESVGAKQFSFTGCPQPLLPLLYDLMRFERPLITWDLFNEAPPAEFRAPSELALMGPADAAAATCIAAAPKRLTHSAAAGPSAAGSDTLPVATVHPTTRPPKLPAMVTLAEFAASAPPSSSASELRDPRSANLVTHAGYSKTQQGRDVSELSFEAWADSFPGRVERVEPQRLYIVKLTDADGEYLLGLIATEGDVVSRHDDESGEDMTYIKGLWFKRRSDSNHSWGPNPEFEQYMDADERIMDELPTESCLLEVEDDDLTENSINQKWSQPKLKQVFMRKVRWVAEKYHLSAAEVPPPAAKRAKRTRR